MGNFISSCNSLAYHCLLVFSLFVFFVSSTAELEFCKFDILEMSAAVVKVPGETGLVLSFHISPFRVCCWKC